ncbi:hypothetical protein FDECE_7740 [Fusarium decemcellulare]|nr:hypothetical protein FDECE_7740 [Fusarium decemcellulare]
MPEYRPCWDRLYWTDMLGHLLERKEIKSDPRFGLVIIRGAYGDDGAWTDAVSTLTREFTMDCQGNYAHLAELYDAPIIEDREKLENAGSVQVRAVFDEWARKDLERLHGSEFEPWEPNRGLPVTWREINCSHGIYTFSFRHEYCIYIDQHCLDSFKTGNDPITRLIARNWFSFWSRPGFNLEKEDLADVNGDTYKFPNRPIEGCRYLDVGWVYVKAPALTSYYENLGRFLAMGGLL